MLTGPDVILRAWRDDDVAALARLRNDVALQQQLMAQPRPNSHARVLQWLKDRSERTDGVFFVVAAASDDRAVGYVQLADMDIFHGHARLGICLSPDAQGTGWAAQAMALLEAYVREVFGLRKIVLEVLCSNARAIRFYDKQGFSTVGVLRQHVFMHGAHVDVQWMEKLL